MTIDAKIAELAVILGDAFQSYEQEAQQLASESAANAALAAGHATSAQDAKTEAVTAKTDAVTAKTEAVDAKTEAVAALDDLTSRYLGAKVSDPTSDNDGGALQTGAMYFNTTTGRLLVYSDGVWKQDVFGLYGALSAANNLSDLSNAGTARNNLGLTSAATTPVFNDPGDFATVSPYSIANRGAIANYLAQQLAAIPAPVAWTALPEVPTDQLLPAHLVTGIPTSATEIEIILRDVLLLGTESFLIQLGNSGGVVTSGYNSGARHSEAATKVSGSSGFVVANVSWLVSISMRIVKNSGDVWDASYIGAETDGGGSTVGAGFSGSIPNVDRIRLQRSGNNMFSGGVMIVRYR